MEEDKFGKENGRDEDADANAGEKSAPSRNLYNIESYAVDEKEIELIQCRVDSVPDFGRFTSLEALLICMTLLLLVSLPAAIKVVSLRQNIISELGSFGANLSSLVELDFNDNQITEIKGLNALVNLKVLDLSYNRISKIEGLSTLVNLKRLYLVHNKISVIEGLESATNLILLELGDNRIKKLENISHLKELEELYLGGNKIRKIENISQLSKLRILSLAGNHLTKLESLDGFADLEELHISDQGIESLDGIENLRKLKILDAGNNRISEVSGKLVHLHDLEDLWLNANRISKWSEVDYLSSIPSLRTVYLEMNPIQEEDRNSYRRKVIMALPQVKQVDAMVCR